MYTYIYELPCVIPLFSIGFTRYLCWCPTAPKPVWIYPLTEIRLHLLKPRLPVLKSYVSTLSVERGKGGPQPRQEPSRSL